MSLAEKLGKMGVPGFRSGRRWKMAIATAAYLFIGFLILAFFVGLSTQMLQEPASAAMQPEQNKQLTQPPGPEYESYEPTPLPEKYISIEHSYKTQKKIQGHTAPAGKTFLIIDFNIENHGYPVFRINPLYWSVYVNTFENPNAYILVSYRIESIYLEDELPVAELLNGGSIKGSEAFLVPEDWDNYEIQYNDLRNERYNIIWK
ncbi:Uncharacterised protein [uncultured archaeon]|nr:Uncharacterised protein [uncultured archaeon]